MSKSKKYQKNKRYKTELTSNKEIKEQPIVKINNAGNIFNNAFLIQGLIVFLFGFAIYTGTLNHKYAVDDALLITENTLTQDGVAGIGDIFKKDAFYGFFGEGYKNLVAGGRYRPLSMSTFALEVEFFGKDNNSNPNYYKAHFAHFVNVLLYALLGLLLFITCFELFKTKKPKTWKELSLPLIIALLYIAHPIHTEVVANIKAREEIMGLIGSLAALFFAIRYVRTNNITFILLVVLSYAFAMFSKESSITFLAVVPLAMYVYAKPKAQHYAAVILLMISTAGTYLYFRHLATGSDFSGEINEILNNPFAGSTKIEQYATAFYTFGEYGKLLLAPITLTHDYYFNQVPIISFNSIKAIIPFILSISIGVYAVIKLVENKSHLSFAILYFFITLSVVSNILFTVGIAMNERFMFMPSLGFSIISAIFLIKATNWIKDKDFSSLDIKQPTILAGVLAVVLGLYAFKTVDRSMDWEDDFTLFSADVINSPNSAKMHNAYGGELFTQAQRMVKSDPKREEYLNKSIKTLKEAIEIYPRYKNAWLLLGNAHYLLNDDLDEAVHYYNKVLEVAPGYYEGLYNLGAVYLEKDKIKDAIIYLELAARAKPNKFNARYNLADAYDKNGDYNKAIASFQAAAQISPNNSDVYFKIGQVYGRKLQDLDMAMTYFNKALELQPNNLYYLEDLGVSYGFKGDYQSAIKVFEKMLTIDPNSVAALRNLSITYIQLKDEIKAAQYSNRLNSLNN